MLRASVGLAASSQLGQDAATRTTRIETAPRSSQLKGNLGGVGFRV